MLPLTRSFSSWYTKELVKLRFFTCSSFNAASCLLETLLSISDVGYEAMSFPYSAMLSVNYTFVILGL